MSATIAVVLAVKTLKDEGSEMLTLAVDDAVVPESVAEAVTPAPVEGTAVTVTVEPAGIFVALTTTVTGLA